MIIGLLEEYGKSKYVCTLILFLLEILEKHDIIREIFRSFLHNYQEELKIIKGSDFVFESVELMDYKLYRVRLRTGGSYIKSSEWLANKKTTINPEN